MYIFLYFEDLSFCHDINAIHVDETATSEDVQEDLKASRVSLRSNKSTASSKTLQDPMEENISASRVSIKSSRSVTSKKSQGEGVDSDTEKVGASRASVKSSRSTGSRSKGQDESAEVREDVTGSRASLKSNLSQGIKKVLQEREEEEEASRRQSDVDIRGSKVSVRSNKSTVLKKGGVENVAASRTSLKSNKSQKFSEEQDSGRKLLASRASIISNKSLVSKGNKDTEAKTGMEEDQSESDDTDSDIVIGTPRPTARSGQIDSDSFSTHGLSLTTPRDTPTTPKKRSSKTFTVHASSIFSSAYIIDGMPSTTCFVL